MTGHVHDVYDDVAMPLHGNGIVGTLTALAWCALAIAFLLCSM